MAAWDHYSDEQLICFCNEGNHRAFEALVRRHIARVYDLCLRMLRSPVEAEDAVQEVFVTVFQKIQTFRGNASFSTWLYRVASNKTLDMIRRRESRLRHAVVVEEIENRVKIPGGDLHRNRGDPEKQFLKREEAELLWNLVDRLPPRYRLAPYLPGTESHSGPGGKPSCRGFRSGPGSTRIHRGRRYSRFRYHCRGIGEHPALESKRGYRYPGLIRQPVWFRPAWQRDRQQQELGGGTRGRNG